MTCENVLQLSATGSNWEKRQCLCEAQLFADAVRIREVLFFLHLNALKEI